MKKIIENWELKIENFRKGFTLVELLIFMGIFSILLTVLTQIFTSLIDVRLESEATSSVEEDGRFILVRLSHDIRRAQSIVTPSTIGATTNTLQIAINGINYTYAVSNGNLEITNNQGTDRLNSNNTSVANLVFQRLGNVGGDNTITFSFTITSITIRPGGPEVKDFRTTVGLRPN